MKIIYISEIMERLKVSRNTVWQWRKSGAFIPEYQFGPRRIGFNEADFDNWCESRKTAA